MGAKQPGFEMSKKFNFQLHLHCTPCTPLYYSHLHYAKKLIIKKRWQKKAPVLGSFLVLMVELANTL